MKGRWDKTALGKQVAALTVLITVSVFVVAPYGWMLLTSFKSTREIMQNPGKLLPIDWTWSGYVTVVTKSPFFSWLVNSAIVSITVTVAVVFTSTLAGYVFSKFKFKGKTALFWLLLATMMVPYQIMMIPQFLIINEIRIYDTLWALIVPELVTAFGIYLCRQFCDDIPDSLCEAAVIDGAGPFKIYRMIMLPLLKPCIGALSIFTFLGIWNEYLKPLIMLNEVKRMTLPLALAFFSDAHTRDIGAIMSASALIMLPATALLLVLQKQFIKGIAITGIK
ncbi:MAG: carbohydrate ABC transporter permease [Clostridiales bacterium]|nr:carbohydrate ABC transporter permease [Clostridiales bacterium]